MPTPMMVSSERATSPFQYFVCKYINYPGILYHKRCIALKGRSDKFGLFHAVSSILVLNAVDTPTWAP